MQQEDPYLGEKARRRGSVDRPVRGDGLGLATNPTVRGCILSKFGAWAWSCQHARFFGRRIGRADQ